MFSSPLSLLETPDDLPEWEKELQAELQVSITLCMEIFDGPTAFLPSYFYLFHYYIAL